MDLEIELFFNLKNYCSLSKTTQVQSPGHERMYTV